MVCYTAIRPSRAEQPSAVFSASASEPRQEPDTRSHRACIWDFAKYEIARRPLLGWGYQSFWLVGPDAASVVEAPGWVKTMPNAHNGYYDTMREMGYVGYFLLVTFIIATAVLDKVVGPDMIAVAPAPKEPKAVDVSEVCEALWIGVS
jgi:hypothetical protein